MNKDDRQFILGNILLDKMKEFEYYKIMGNYKNVLKEIKRYKA
jgi:hypothetical protein